jgi:hypothetical protein
MIYVMGNEHMKGIRSRLTQCHPPQESIQLSPDFCQKPFPVESLETTDFRLKKSRNALRHHSDRCSNFLPRGFEVIAPNEIYGFMEMNITMKLTRSGATLTDGQAPFQIL